MDEKKRAGTFDEVSGKRHRPGPSISVDTEFNMNSINQMIDAWGETLLGEIKERFRTCETMFQVLTDKIDEMATDLNCLTTVKGDASGVDASGVKSKDDPASASKEKEQPAAKEAPVSHKTDMNKPGESQGLTDPSTQPTPLVVSSESSDTDTDSDTDSDTYLFIRTEIPPVAELSARDNKQEPSTETGRLAAQGKVDMAKRLASMASIQRSPFLADNTAKAIISEPPTANYNPFQRAANDKKKTLVDFLKQDATYNKDFSEKSPIFLWWYQLQTKAQWLGDTHMDACLNLLRHRYTKQPQLFTSDRIAFLDSMFSHMWTSKYMKFVNSKPNPDGSGRILPPGAFSYYNGEYPPYAKTNKKWGLEVDNLYAPLNVKQSHWVAMFISIPMRHIQVWDSIPSFTNDEELATALDPIAVMLPYVMRELASTEMKDMYPTEKYTHERITKGVPQNNAPGDCGVYALKFIECHAHGIPFSSTLCDAHMPWIREKLACDIFHEIECRGPNEELYDEEIDLYDPLPIRE